MLLFTRQTTPLLADASRGGAPHEGAELAMQTGTIARTDLQPAPLKPTWILADNPSARALTLGEAADGNFLFALWDCTAGQFKFIHRCDEFVHILEGEVTIRAADTELHLRPGDVAFFPQGLTTYWTVHGYVKKLAIFRSAPRGWLARIAGKVKRVWRGILSR
ncbi:MAG: cupin domain-containing protein [Planctomycetota bacterium]